MPSNKSKSEKTSRNGFERRTQSVGRLSDINQREQKERADQPDDPCHKAQDSLLSSSSNYTNYRGVLNLCIVLLILSNSRVALENVMKYGILVDPIQWLSFLGEPSVWPSVQIILGLNVFIMISLSLEKYFFSNGLIRDTSGQILVIFNIVNLIVIPAVIMFKFNCHPVASSIALGFVTIICLKLVSYHMVNYWYRRDLCQRCHHHANHHLHLSPTDSNLRRHRSSSHTERREETNKAKYIKSSSIDKSDEEKKVQYPDNLNLRDIYYFIFAPTLCYELNFPRSKRIRKRFLIRRFLEMVLLLNLNLALVQQWIMPTIKNSLNPLVEMDYIRMFERLLKLAVPNHIIWLLSFYWLFHSSLNFIGEILRFADREFYQDWWNSESVQYFWANWNIPVHRWCLRHLYKPLLRKGLTKYQASIAVFFVSAFFHEYLVSVPLKLFRIWAFSGMLFQIPFAMLVAKFKNYPQYANIAVWISLIIGQPLCILMYYHDYYVIHTINYM